MLDFQKCFFIFHFKNISSCTTSKNLFVSFMEVPTITFLLSFKYTFCLKSPAILEIAKWWCFSKSSNSQSEVLGTEIEAKNYTRTEGEFLFPTCFEWKLFLYPFDFIPILSTYFEFTFTIFSTRFECVLTIFHSHFECKRVFSLWRRVISMNQMFWQIRSDFSQ